MALIPALIRTAQAYKQEKERQLERAHSEAEAARKKSESEGFSYKPTDVGQIISTYKQRIRSTAPQPYKPKFPAKDK